MNLPSRRMTVPHNWGHGDNKMPRPSGAATGMDLPKRESKHPQREEDCWVWEESTLPECWPRRMLNPVEKEKKKLNHTFVWRAQGSRVLQVMGTWCQGPFTTERTPTYPRGKWRSVGLPTAACRVKTDQHASHVSVHGSCGVDSCLDSSPFSTRNPTAHGTIGSPSASNQSCRSTQERSSGPEVGLPPQPGRHHLMWPFVSQEN